MRVHNLSVTRQARRLAVRAFGASLGRLDLRYTRRSRLSVGLGAAVAALTAAAIAVPGRGGEAAIGAAAAFVAVTGICWLLLARAAVHETESRALWSLSALSTGDAIWPAPGGWALDAEAALLLVTELGVRQAHTVVELGPGTSSVILARAGAGTLELYGLEHDSRLAEVTRWHLRRHDVKNYTLLEAPLSKQTLAGRTVEWYDPAALEQLPAQIDALVVDGPPEKKGDASRAPAWPLLRGRLQSGALVFVDDSDRWEERRMVREWLAGGGLRVLADHLTFMLLEVE